jgi:hypothetical protein
VQKLLQCAKTGADWAGVGSGGYLVLWLPLPGGGLQPVLLCKCSMVQHMPAAVR